MKEKECFGCGQIHDEKLPCPPFRRPYTADEIEKMERRKK